MSFTDKKREEIKKYILRKIALDDADVIAKTMDNFGVSITSVKRYLQEAIKDQMIEAADDRKCGYELVEQSFGEVIDLNTTHLAEDQIYELYIEKYLKFCNADALKIWQYTCSEMLNNALEHSRGSKLYIEVRNEE